MFQLVVQRYSIINPSKVSTHTEALSAASWSLGAQGSSAAASGIQGHVSLSLGQPHAFAQR